MIDKIPQASNVLSPGKNTGVTNRTAVDPRATKAREAAQGFEGMFIRYMINEMRKTIPKDELVEEGMADQIYKDQLFDHYADQWQENGGIGLADMIYQQLTERYGVPQTTTANGAIFHSAQEKKITAPAEMKVLRSENLADGRKALVLAGLGPPDKGPEVHMIHNGVNHVSSGTQVKKGDTLATTASGAPLFFGLRKRSANE